MDSTKIKNILLLLEKEILKESDEFAKGETVTSIDTLKKGGDYFLFNLNKNKWIGDYRFKGVEYIFENNKTGNKISYSRETLIELIETNEVAKQEYK